MTNAAESNVYVCAAESNVYVCHDTEMRQNWVLLFCAAESNVYVT